MFSGISIITPSYNQGLFIERTIQSVLSQDIECIEYWVIDGGSTDTTIDVLKKYSDKLYWVSEKDNGQADAVNKGLLRSTSPILGWLNSDDIYYPNILSIVLEYFDSHPDIDVVYGDANHIDADDNLLGRYPTEKWDWERLKTTCFISQPATFIRRRVFQQCGLLDINLRSADYEYWLRLGKTRVGFAYIPRLLAATRLHPAAFTVAFKTVVHKEVNDITRRHFGKTPDEWIFNYAHVVTDDQGISRKNRLRFAMAVSLVSWYAALRWNHSISWHVLKTTTFWISANLRNWLWNK
jgi:glycosyltransferase involved in cell wall biosynthesis